MKTFPWSLRDLDETDVESVFDFMSGFQSDNPSSGRTVYCDQVNFF